MPITWRVSALAVTVFLSSVSAGTMLVSGDFNATAYEGTMSCLKAASVSHDVAIDDGQTIIVPKEGSTFNINGRDSAIESCMQTYSSSLRLAMDVTRDNTAGLNVVSSDAATAEWAESEGAEGMTLEETEDDDEDSMAVSRRGGTLAAREPKDFRAYGHAEDGKCQGKKTLIKYNADDCPANEKGYKSVKYINPSKDKHFRLHIYSKPACTGYENLIRVTTLAPKAVHCVEANIHAFNGFYPKRV